MGQSITTTTQKTGTSFRYTTADANAQTFSNNLTGTVSWEDGGITYSRSGTLVFRFTGSGNVLEAIAFDSADGDLLLVLSGSFTTSTSYTGNSGNLGTAMDDWVAATEPSAASSTISANPTSITADGTTTSTVTVTVKLSDGTAISGASVVLSQTSGVASTISGATTTSTTGVATFTVSGTVAGTGTYQATAQNGGSQTIITSTVSITFVPGPVSLSVSTITASPTSITANGTSTSTITVQLKDAQGNNRTTSGGTLVLARTLGSLGLVTDHLDGTYTATLTSGTVSGTSTISGTLAGSPLTDTEAVAFVAGPATKLAFATQPSSVVAGASISPSVTVEVLDANNNRVTTATDSITLAIGTNPGSGTLSGTATVSAVAGVATFSSLSIDKIGTGYTLSASSGSLSGATSTAFNVTPGSASTAQTTITASPSSLIANGTSTSTITVQLKDAYGNNLSASGGTILLNTTLGTLGSVTDNNNGTYTATLTSGVTGGTATITGTLGGASLSNSASVVLTDASLSTSTLSATPSSITADGTSTSTITVQLKNSSGNDLSTSGGVVVLNTTLGSLGSVTDNNNGTYTATLTAGTVAGSATITGTLGGNAFVDDASVTLVAGPASKLGFAVQPSSVVAGAS
ncbi:MAG: invasin domain 3-containing protein, partial [Limisphaerales bacterium]